MNKWNFTLATATLMCSLSNVQAQQPTIIESSPTRIIVIEEKTDRFGNRTVTRTEQEGNFTDEEINAIIKAESQTQDSVRAIHGPKGYLGVMIDNVEGGVRITEVREGSPAQAAGLKTGDIVTAVNETHVTNLEGLVDVVSAHKPGETVKVHYIRDGAASTLMATLGVREEPEVSDVFQWDENIVREHQPTIEAERFKKADDFNEAQKLHEKMMEEHKAKAEKEKSKEKKPRFGVNIDESPEGVGVIVTHVYEGSIAEQAGLEEGDVITSFNGIEVNTSEELIEAVQSSPVGDKVKVNFLREGKKMKEKVIFERT